MNFFLKKLLEVIEQQKFCVCVIKVKTELFCLLRRPVVQQQYGRLEINFSLKKPKPPYKALAVQECFYSAGPLSTETTEIHRVSINVES